MDGSRGGGRRKGARSWLSGCGAGRGIGSCGAAPLGGGFGWFLDRGGEEPRFFVMHWARVHTSY